MRLKSSGGRPRKNNMKKMPAILEQWIFWCKNLRLKTVFLACLAVVLLAWSFLTVQIHYVGYERPYGGDTQYHSDDAAQSNIMWDWQHGYREGARVGDDNWFVKYPLYFATNNLPVSPLTKLFINSWVVVMATAALVMFVLYQFAKRLVRGKHKQKLALVLSSIALIAIPAQAFGTIKMPNSRNVEIGIFLLLLLAFYCYANKDKWFKSHFRLKVAGVLLLTGILYADDPLFIYLGAVPFGLTVGLLYFVGKMKGRMVAGLLAFIAGSLMVGVVIKMLLTAVLPLRFYHHNSGIATFDAVLDNTRHFFGSGIGIFGADIFGRYPARPSTALAVLMAALAIVAIAGFFFAWKKKTDDPFRLYVLLLFAWTPLIGVITTLAVHSEVSRYLIVLPLLGPLGVMLAVNEAKLRRQIVLIGVVVVLAAGLSLAMKSAALAQVKTGPNSENFALIENLKKLSVDKGYATGRHAGINTFLSGRAITIYPVLCKKGEPTVRDIFFDEAHLKERAKRSFYLVSAGRSCSKETIIERMGEPEKTVSLPNGLEALVYNFDLAEKMPLRQ